MADPNLPDDFIVPTRDKIRDDYLRDYKLRNPAGDISKDTQPWIDASTFADQQTAVYALAKMAAYRALVRSSFGAALDALGEAETVPRRPAQGGAGFVDVRTSAGGGTIFEGDELTLEGPNLRFTVAATATYSTGIPVPITGFDTGAATNLPPGTVLKFTSPRPGISPTATVFAQTGGRGLIGGAADEEDGQYQERIIARRASRPASGNEAQYREEIENTPGVPVEKAFAYPAILGPGTKGVAFTVRAGAAGASRRPSAGQISQAETHLRGVMPGDDMIFAAAVLSDPVTLVFRIAFATAALGWVDASPWPPRHPLAGDGTGAAVGVDGALTPTATVFRLKALGPATYAAMAQPAVGQTVAFFDPSTRTFAKKRIGAVSGTGPWTITADATNGASDVRYVPVANQRALPYAPGLDALIAPVAAYVDGMGPGEMVASFVDPSVREKRQPQSPKTFPSVIDNRVATALVVRPEVHDATNTEGVGHVAPVGTPGVAVYLTELADLAFFPL
jgi:uncharacterized phage protein gp47/JayE